LGVWEVGNIILQVINGIRTCAGNACIKESYPFHCGATLADSLALDSKERFQN